MKLRGRLLLLFVLAALPVTVQAQSTSGFGRFHAVVIGNKNYRHLPVLKTPLNDAEEVAKVLQEQYGFTVEPLPDKTRAEIMAVLYKLRDTMTEEDNLLIYYAGHGKFDKANEAGYWQPIDAEQANPANWISIDDIDKQIKAIRARHVLVVADSCYSGSLVMRDSDTKPSSNNIGRDEWLRRMQSGRSRNALTSGGEEPVADGGGGGHSIFAKVLLEALRENKEILDGEKLFNLIKEPVVANVRQTPLYGIIYDTGHAKGDFIFVPKELQRTVAAAEKMPARPVDLSFLQERGGEKAPKQGDTMTEPITGMEFVYVPGGCFQMGSPENEKDRDKDEGPVHEVCVDGFWMGKYEVTQGQWQKITDENPSTFKKGSNYPVEQVSWDDTKTFIAKLNEKSGKKYRLPTEAEWEYACRANGSGKYCGGDNVDAVAWHGEGFNGSTHPVGEKQKNGFGLYDMSGNVWEWCADWYGKDYYASRPNPLGPSSGSYRVIRGNSWDSAPGIVRAADRRGYAPVYRNDELGFRLLLPGQQSQAGR